jgi:hypothetical protein
MAWTMTIITIFSVLLERFAEEKKRGKQEICQLSYLSPCLILCNAPLMVDNVGAD